MTDAPTFTADFAHMRQEIRNVKLLVNSLATSTCAQLADENEQLRRENAELRRKLELYELERCASPVLLSV
jgi:hypothetical protein